ncbi:hypothetical protein IW262DRAFT_1298150 [Armillaria fumosa]|nr:hypothetical protein IW262DRAFT_1298150 [Armillaria fumosa]
MNGGIFTGLCANGDMLCSVVRCEVWQHGEEVVDGELVLDVIMQPAVWDPAEGHLFAPESDDCKRGDRIGEVMPDAIEPISGDVHLALAKLLHRPHSDARNPDYPRMCTSGPTLQICFVERIQSRRIPSSSKKFEVPSIWALITFSGRNARRQTQLTDMCGVRSFIDGARRFIQRLKESWRFKPVRESPKAGVTDEVIPRAGTVDRDDGKELAVTFL